MTDVTKAADPRTIIAQSLQKSLHSNDSVAITTIKIAESLAQWLTMKAENMQSEDERLHGYGELAQRLSGR